MKAGSAASIALAAALVAFAGPLAAASPDADARLRVDFSHCALQLVEARCDCYDRVARSQEIPLHGEEKSPADGHYLRDRWDLASQEARDFTNIVPHRLNYGLPVKRTTALNTQQFTPAPGHTVTTPADVQNN